MKISFSATLCAALCVVLTVSALCLGAVRGWSRERESALYSLSSEGEMYSQLLERAMDAANLAVVAARHVPADDDDLLRLRQIRRTLEKEGAAVQELAQADLELTALAESIGAELMQLDSVQASARDTAYITSLTHALSDATGMSDSYASQMTDYNDRLTSSLTGRLAMLLGVEPLGQ